MPESATSTDRAVSVMSVAVGDTLRLFGPNPSATIIKVERVIMQGLHYRYTITLDDGSSFERWDTDTLTLIEPALCGDELYGSDDLTGQDVIEAVCALPLHSRATRHSACWTGNAQMTWD